MRVHAYEIAYCAIVTDRFNQITELLGSVTAQAREFDREANFSPAKVFSDWFNDEPTAVVFRLWLEWLQTPAAASSKASARKSLMSWELHGFGSNDNGDPRWLPQKAAYDFAMSELLAFAYERHGNAESEEDGLPVVQHNLNP